MKSTQILMIAPQVRAILNSTQRQTRRIVRKQPKFGLCKFSDEDFWRERDDDGSPSDTMIKCPYGDLGDELWVRETWGFRGTMWHNSGEPDEVLIEYLADRTRRSIEFPHDTVKSMKLPEQRRLRVDESQDDYREYLHRFWEQSRPSIFMPRWASRITLRITDVRVERLQDISEEDAIAEGIERINRDDRWWRCYAHGGRCGCLMDPVASYASLWRSINGPGSWELNPWVWNLAFERIEK